MGDKSSTRRAQLAAELAKRILASLSARALWAVVREVYSSYF